MIRVTAKILLKNWHDDRPIDEKTLHATEKRPQKMLQFVASPSLPLLSITHFLHLSPLHSQSRLELFSLSFTLSHLFICVPVWLPVFLSFSLVLSVNVCVIRRAFSSFLLSSIYFEYSDLSVILLSKRLVTARGKTWVFYYFNHFCFRLFNVETNQA